MSKTVKQLLLLSILPILLIAEGCGGGGGGGTGSPQLTVSTSGMFFGAPAGGSQPASQGVTGTVSNYSGTLYLYIVHTANGISNISMPTYQGNSGTSLVTVHTPYNLGQGVYFDTITVSACTDSACTNHLPGSPVVIPVTYVVGIAVVPSSLTFTSTVGVAPPSQTLQVYHYAPNTSWGSSYLAASWMTYNPANDVAPSTVTVNASAMTAGSYNSFIRFGADAGTSLIDVPITYTVN